MDSVVWMQKSYIHLIEYRSLTLPGHAIIMPRLGSPHSTGTDPISPIPNPQPKAAQYSSQMQGKCLYLLYLL
jgi:hypothetical protein